MAQTDVSSLGRGVGSPWHKPCVVTGRAWGLLGTNRYVVTGWRERVPTKRDCDEVLTLRAGGMPVD